MKAKLVKFSDSFRVQWAWSTDPWFALSNASIQIPFPKGTKHGDLAVVDLADGGFEITIHRDGQVVGRSKGKIVVQVEAEDVL